MQRAKVSGGGRGICNLLICGYCVGANFFLCFMCAYSCLSVCRSVCASGHIHFSWVLRPLRTSADEFNSREGFHFWRKDYQGISGKWILTLIYTCNS